MDLLALVKKLKNPEAFLLLFLYAYFGALGEITKSFKDEGLKLTCYIVGTGFFAIIALFYIKTKETKKRKTEITKEYHQGLLSREAYEDELKEEK